MSAINDSIIAELLLNRDLNDYIEVVDKLFIAYIRTDEFCSLAPGEREKTIDCVLELKCLVSSIQGKENKEKAGTQEDEPASERS